MRLHNNLAWGAWPRSQPGAGHMLTAEPGLRGAFLRRLCGRQNIGGLFLEGLSARGVRVPSEQPVSGWHYM